MFDLGQSSGLVFGPRLASCEVKLYKHFILLCGGQLSIQYHVPVLLSHCSPVRLCDPVPGILQARTLKWAAISFFNA